MLLGLRYGAIETKTMRIRPMSIDPSRSSRFLLFLCCMSLAVTTGGAAEESPPLVTDRPDVTESSEIVSRGYVQFETGINFANFDNAEESVGITTFPTTLIRVGLDRKVELRFEWLGLVSESRNQDGTDVVESGPGNTALGAKIKLREERGAAPRLALLVNAILPTGSKAFRADRIDPGVRAAGSNTLSDRLGLSYNLGVVALTLEEDDGDVDTHALGRYSVSLGIGLDPRWGAFVELFGFVPLGGPEPSEHLFDLGFTYLTSKTVQLDLSGGFGLNEDADDWFVGAGLSFRLPS
jgi:hypothetical protein